MSTILRAVRKSLSRFSTSNLTSHKILSQRSAVPALYPRPNAPSKWKSPSLTHAEKARLLRMRKALRRDLFDQSREQGSRLASDEPKASGKYDVWTEGPAGSEIINVK